jgi:hypothetical protein
MAFFSRQHPRTFISYKLQFDVTPGMVILDATADIAGVNVLMSGMELVDTPPVSFKNQKTYRIEKPKRFTGRVSEILRPRDVAHEYAELVKQVIRDTSKEGEQLLLIVPSLLIDTHQEFPLAVDAPREFEQRQVFVIYWGCPSIGNSDWRSCTRVYCFEEFWMPRHVIIGEDLGRLEVTAKDAEQDGRLSVGASLVDRYKDLQERHLMRHQKQISCRGHVRELDPDTGECGHMTLYTTCDRVRFTKWFGQLYPQAPAHQRLDYSEWTADQPFWQAPEPEVGSYAAAVREQKTRTGVDRLIDVLELTHERLIDGARFEKITGLGKNKMIRTFMSPRVQDFITGTWWKLGWNSDVGLKGKGRVIYRAPSPRTA